MAIFRNVGQDRLAAIEWACKKLNHSIDRSNMNRRPIAESLDDKIMGDIATIVVCQYLREKGYGAIAYDQIRIDNFEKPDPGWDVLLAKPEDKKRLNNWGRSTTAPLIAPEYALTISVKSSRLPIRDTIEAAIRTRDFKIFDMHNKSIDDDLTADIETQVYYDYHNTQLDKNIIITKKNVEDVIKDRVHANIIDNVLSINERFQSCILARWNFSENISESCKERLKNSSTKAVWESYGKRMWLAPLHEGYSFKDVELFF